jgi:hypothetical protein
VDCSTAPGCMSLNRFECQDTSNTCGRCLPGASAEVDDQTASNEPCVQSVDHASMATLGWKGTIAYTSFEEPETFTVSSLVGSAWTVAVGACQADGWCVRSPAFPAAYDSSAEGEGDCVLTAEADGVLSCTVFDTAEE